METDSYFISIIRTIRPSSVATTAEDGYIGIIYNRVATIRI